MIQGLVGLSALVITANANMPALEEANQQEPKPNFISNQYIVAQTLSTLEVEWEYTKLPAKLFEDDNGQCINFARALTGRYDIRGDAIEWKSKVNAKEPELGAVIVFSYGHVGVVFRINYATHTIWIVERNYVGKWIVNERELKMDREDIVGYVIKPM